MMNKIAIETERIRLRLTDLTDLASIHALHSLPETDQYNIIHGSIRAKNWSAKI